MWDFIVNWALILGAFLFVLASITTCGLLVQYFCWIILCGASLGGFISCGMEVIYTGNLWYIAGSLACLWLFLLFDQCRHLCEALYDFVISQQENS